MSMVFRLTGKLGKKIGVAPSSCLPVAEDPLVDWCAHLFRVQGVQYILMTNTRSLYCAILAGRGVTDDDSFIKSALSGIAAVMKRDGFEAVFEKRIVPHSGVVSFSKTGDRRVLGSINDFVYQAGYQLAVREPSPFDASMSLNAAPMSLIGMDSPMDAFKALGA